MKLVEFKLTEWQDHIGHCQLNYVAKNDLGQKIQYCLQDNGEKFGGIRLMRCTQDFEPNYEVTKFKEGILPVFELPELDGSNEGYAEKLKALCIEWIKKGKLK